MQIQINVFHKLPDSRQNRDKKAAAVVCVVLCLVLSFISEQMEKDINYIEKNLSPPSMWLFLMMLAVIFLAHATSEFLRRLCLLWEEWYHVKERYNHSKKQVLQSTMPSTKIIAMYVVAVVILCSIFWYLQYLLLCMGVVLIYTIGYLLLHIMGSLGLREAELLNLADAQLNLGQAFAWQYYYGYLKIVLPDFIERIKEYESIEEVKIMEHKLFILLPESCQLTPDLSNHDADHKFLEHAKDLKEVCRDRNGTRGRIYKNPVYRINGPHEPIYCCMEGAAILNSLHEMCEGEKLTGITEEKKFQHVIQFYSALQEILRGDTQLGDLVELVLYKDLDSSGEQVRIVDVVLQRIRILRTGL